MSGSRVLDGISGDSTIRIEHAWIETLHIVATACLAFVTLGTLFRQMGGTGWLIAAIAAMIVLLGMFVARSLSALIGDLYRQMQYRERFLVFLLHMGLVIVPWVTRMATLPVALMGLLVVLSFQCIDKLFVARLQALLWFIMLLACGGGVDPVPWWLCVGFGVLMLLSVRLAHVAFRLQRHDRGDLSMPLSDMVLRSFWRILPVGLVGWLAWEVASRGLTPREFVYTVRPLRAAPPVGAATLSFSQLFWFSLA
ncbi:hypothetical protein GC173_17795, partial [bacterium]|nr:hypothetical protein [bacterium]